MEAGSRQEDAFLATAGIFGYAGGSEWGVSHCRMKAGV
jgi:cyclopropane-fatty-acyl-phospholipid synthase